MRSIGGIFPETPQKGKPGITPKLHLFHRMLVAAGLLVLTSAVSPLLAQAPALPDYDPDDWSDLEREAPYGSEKEDKYRINALIVEEEAWDRHYSLGVLGLFRYTDYPVFHSLRVLPFYSSIQAKNDPRRSRWLFPMYYSEFDGRSYLQITPLSLRSYDTNGDGFGLYGYLYVASREQSETSHTLLPLFSISQDAARDSLGLTVLPLFYAHSLRDEFTLIAPGFYYASTPGRSTTASLLHYYHNRDDEDGNATTLVAPGYYRKGETTAAGVQRSQTLVGPFWHSNDGEGDTACYLFPLFAYSSKDVSAADGTIVQRTRSTFWAPIFFPIHYRSDDSASGIARLYGPVYYERNSDGELESLIAAPFYFQSRNEHGDSSRHVLPFFASWQTADQMGEGDFRSQLLTPLAYFDQAPGRSLHLSPFYFYSSRETTNSQLAAGDSAATRATTFLAPIVPLYYASDDPETGSVRWYGNLRYKSDAAGEFESFWAAPLVFYKPGENGYLYAAPLYFRSRWQEEADETRSFGFLHYYRHQKNEARESAFFLTYLAYYSRETETESNSQRTTQVNPLYFYSDRQEREGTDLSYRTTLWFPLPLPLHYRSDDSERGSARQYGPVYYEHDRRENLERLIAAPLLFYRPRNYLHIVPLYFQPRHDQATHKSFSLLHYAHLQKRNTPEAKGVVWAGPYYRSFNEKTKRYFAHLAPLYFSYDTPESQFDLALPAYLRYESERRYIHVNAVGLSISREKLPIPRLARSDRNEWYLEQDIALFYNLFRLSTRVTLSEAGESESAAPVAPEASFPEGLTGESAVEAPEAVAKDWREDRNAGDRRRSVSRENSRSYWGIQSLYGMVAYERADTRRHFRILPLSWFTWDEATENRVYMVPGGFLSYVDESTDREYFALFPGFAPLYGYQREGESYIAAYLGLGYISEYDAESETREHSILWPLANFHSSPRRSGGRVLPLFYQRTDRDPEADGGESERSTTVSPLYFARIHSTTSNRTTLRISPLFYSSSFEPSPSSLASGRPAAYESTLVLPVPGVRIRDTDQAAGYNWLGLTGLYYTKTPAPHRNSSEQNGVEQNALSRLTSAYFAPFYFYKENAYSHLLPLHFSLRNQEDTAVTHFGPGYYYSRDAGCADCATVAESTLILPGFYRSEDSTGSRKNVLLLADWSNDAAGDLNHVLLFPLFGYSPQKTAPESTLSDDGGSHAFFAPLYYGYSRESSVGRESLSVSPLFFRSHESRSASDTESDTLFLPAPGLYLNENETTSTYSWLGLAGLHFQESELRQLWTAPVLFYGKDSFFHLAPFYFSTRSADGTRLARFGPGYYYSRDGDDASVMVLPGFYRDRYKDHTYTNLLLAASYERDEAGYDSAGVFPVFSHQSNQGDAGRDSHLYAFPFYYGREGYSRTISLHVLPAIYSEYTRAGDFKLFAAGLYVRRSPGYQRDNLLYLIDRKREETAASEVYSSYGLLFHSMSYENEPDAHRFAMGYGFLAGLSSERYPDLDGDAGSFAANLLWLTHESRPDYTHNSFFPLWWYDRDADRSLWAFAPLLSGGLHEGAETTRLIGGGALYYEFADRSRNEYSRAVLLGVLYSDTARRERGYRSRGSLWNYLWQYQSESESDFEKFSLLKFVYSRTRHAGRTRTRVLGIRVHES